MKNFKRNLILVLCLMLLSSNIIYSQSLKIHTIHVHGDAHLVQTPGGKTMLIDAGSPWHVDRIKSFIDSLGIDTIDIAYLSHAHRDHFGGFTGEDGILATYHVSEFYGVDEFNSKTVFNNMILPYSKNAAIEYQVMKRGDLIELDPALEIKILFPPDPYPNVGLNEGSAACMITDLRNGRKFLYMGDGMEQQHRQLVNFYGDDLRCDVLKYGHHTQFVLDDHYSLGPFMEIAKPNYGIITKQAMPNNEPGHGQLTQASFDKLYNYTWGSDTGLKSFMLGTHGHITVECPEDGVISISTSIDYIPPIVSASEQSGIKDAPFTLTLTLSEPYHENIYPGERRGYYSLDDGTSWNEFLYPAKQLEITNTITVLTRARDMYGNSSSDLEYQFEFEEHGPTGMNMPDQPEAEFTLPFVYLNDFGATLNVQHYQGVAEIYDITGMLIMSIQDASQPVNVESLPRGVYIFKTIAGAVKFVK